VGDGGAARPGSDGRAGGGPDGDAAGARPSENEKLRLANEALRARMARQVERWPAQPEPAQPRQPETADMVAWARRYVEVALEAAGVALALFTDEGRLIAVNARLAALFPDAAPRLGPGARFDDVVRQIAEAGALDLPGPEARAVWAQARIAARGRVVAPAVAPLTGGRWVEIAERRAGLGAFALAFEDVTDQMLLRLRDRAAAAGFPALVQGALDNLGLGIAVFDHDGGLALWNEPFRAMMGLGLNEMVRGAAFDRLAGRIVAEAGLDPAGPVRRAALWAAGTAPRGPLTVELDRDGGGVLEVAMRDTPDGGFVISAQDATAARRAAAEVERVRRTLEQRVTERTAALVGLNDRLVQEVAERRAIEAEMRRARDAAERANLSKTRFLAAASHDLLQPLNAARLFISALNASDLPADAADIARKAEAAFGSVETLLNALLDISRLDAGGGDARLSDFPVALVMDAIAREFSPLAAARGLRLRVARSRLVVRSDPHHLRRIVQNLVGNALKYTPKGGVVVGCRRRGDRVRIEVWDSGVGIPAAERRRIFEEFHRVETGNPRGERGMGLGLAIVDRAARLLGHPVDVRSIQGAGSLFSVTVPLGDAAEAARAARRDEDDDGAPADAQGAAGGAVGGQAAEDERGMIALVLDDDPDARAATTALLSRWGVDALEAATGAEALAQVDQLGMAPDVILADYHLGRGETGLQAIAALRRMGCGPAALLTADRTAEVAQAAGEAEVQLLSKPVSPARLRAVLRWSRTAAE
jgi:signal transduction histidine kinase/CheY-like chemotaxis protein